MDVKSRMVFDARSGTPHIDPEFQVFLKCWASEFVTSDKISLVLTKMQRALVEQQNYGEKEAALTIHLIMHHIESNRHSFMENFMG